MATELGSAFISVGMGTNTLAGDIKKAFGGAESSGSDAGKSAGRGFGGAFGIAAAAIGALGIGTFFKSAIDGAGVLEQSIGAIDAVFKGSAGQMHAWSKSAAMDVGLTQNEFNELGTLIGAQLKNGGTAMDELAPKTQNLIGTGADLASMFGGTTADAVGALSSALKGERDPIERYGVSLNQTKIDAEAAALGFAKVGGSLSAEASQAATLSLIMKQTADAHGNFASEADTLAGKQQRLNAVWQNGKTELGTALLPAVSAVTGTLLKGLAPALVGAQVATRETIGGFTALGEAFKAGGDDITSNGFAGVMEHIGLAARRAFDGLAPIVGSLGASFGPLIPQVLSLLSAFSPLGLVFKAIQPILPQLATVFAQLGSVIAGTLSTALTALMPIVNLFVANLSQLAIGVMPAVSQIVVMLGAALGTLAPVIAGVITQLAPLISSLMTQLVPIILNLVSSVLPPLVSVFGDIVTAIAPLITIIAAALIPIIAALLPVVVTVFSAVANVIKSVMQIVQGVIQVVTGIISGNWSKVWQGIQNVLAGVWSAIGAIISGAMRSFGAVVSGGIGAVVGFFGGIGGKILGSLGNLGGLLMNAGRQILDGFLSGLRAGFESVKNFVGGIGAWIAANKGPKAYDLALLVPAGGWIMEGLGKGIEDSLPALQRTLGGVSATIAAGVTGANYSPAYTPALAGVAGVPGAFPSRMTLMVGGREFDAYVTSMADSSIQSADSNSQFTRRGR